MHELLFIIIINYYENDKYYLVILTGVYFLLSHLMESWFGCQAALISLTDGAF